MQQKCCCFSYFQVQWVWDRITWSKADGPCKIYYVVKINNWVVGFLDNLRDFLRKLNPCRLAKIIFWHVVWCICSFKFFNIRWASCKIQRIRMTKDTRERRQTMLLCRPGWLCWRSSSGMQKCDMRNDCRWEKTINLNIKTFIAVVVARKDMEICWKFLAWNCLTIVYVM